jgi:hypothetical protein
MEYAPRPETRDRIDHNFIYHPPHGDQAERYAVVRAEHFGLARLLLRLCPESRELSLALTKLEESVFWANAAIARNEKPPA